GGNHGGDRQGDQHQPTGGGGRRCPDREDAGPDHRAEADGDGVPQTQDAPQPGGLAHHPVVNDTGVGSRTVRDTVHSRSRERSTAPGRRSRAASPPSPCGKVTDTVTVTGPRWLPCSSRTFRAAAETSKASGSASREVSMSTSMPEHPATAASRSSTGEK